MTLSFINNGDTGLSVRNKLNDRFQVLGQSSVAVSAAADTAENTLATVTVPGGAMGANGRLRITTYWTGTNSANNKICRTKFGGVTVGQPIFTTSAYLADQRWVGNRHSASSQVASSTGTSGFGATSSAIVTASIDTSSETTVTITGQKAAAGETLTLESYIVELLYSA